MLRLASRPRIMIVFSVLLAVLIPPAGRPVTSHQRRAVDFLLLNARVITMDPTKPTAQAISIQGDRIAWVGTTDEAQRLFTNPSRVIDLHGATILPGLIDAHVHLLALGQSLLRLNLKDVADEKEAVTLVKQRVATANANEWIVGWGW